MVKTDTLNERKQYIDLLKSKLQEKINLDNVQIFVFGSFLTSEFIPGKSDIDIGIYSPDEMKMYDIKYELEKILDADKLMYDIIIMELNDKLWINIPIMVYGKAITSFEDNNLFEYLKKMINKWSFNPLEYSMTRKVKRSGHTRKIETGRI